MKFGFFDFIFSTTWDYGEEIFGAGRALLGSILTALIALIMYLLINILELLLLRLILKQCLKIIMRWLVLEQ